MKKTNKKGFTIVELVIVIAVIAILAAVMIPTFVSLINKANESSDIQAVREMNLFLTTADITGDIESPLDVYDIFDESGFEVENYKPLYEGRIFYYDVQYNKVLYVDESTGKVLFPAEHKDEVCGDHDWFTLSLTMSVSEADKPTDFVLDSASGAMSATVSSGREYAYVIEEYNNTSSAAALNIVVDGELDLKGATIVIKEAKGPITICAAVDGEGNAKEAVIKNIASNKFASVSTNNTSGIAANYQAAALVAKSNYTVSVSNVTFENLNVKVPDAGNVALLCGGLSSGGSLVIDNVTIKNSTVIGGRSVAALVGATAGGSGPVAVVLNGDLTLQNVNVYTTQGRSALLVTTNSEKAMTIAADAEIEILTSYCKYYEYDALDNMKTDETSFGTLTGHQHKIVDKDGKDYYDFGIYSTKTLNGDEKTFYAHKDDALVLQYSGSNTRTAYMTVEDLYTKYQVVAQNP